MHPWLNVLRSRDRTEAENAQGGDCPHGVGSRMTTQESDLSPTCRQNGGALPGPAWTSHATAQLSPSSTGVIVL